MRVIINIKVDWIGTAIWNPADSFSWDKGRWKACNTDFHYPTFSFGIALVCFILVQLSMKKRQNVFQIITNYDLHHMVTKCPFIWPKICNKLKFDKKGVWIAISLVGGILYTHLSFFPYDDTQPTERGTHCMLTMSNTKLCWECTNLKWQIHPLYHNGLTSPSEHKYRSDEVHITLKKTKIVIS